MKSNLMHVIRKNILATILLTAIFSGLVSVTFGQTNTWDGSSSNNWNTAANWSLNLVPTSAHDVVIPNNYNVTVNTAAVCNTFTINSGGNDNTITISTGQSLTVSGAVIINGGTGNNDDKIIAVGSGTFTCASITMADPGNNNRDCIVSISTGTVNVSGNVTMNGSAGRNQFTFTGAGTLNIGGSISGGDLISVAGSIVNYNGTSSQTIAINTDYVYTNLHINNTAGATLQAAVTTTNVTGNIRVQTGTLNNGGFAMAGGGGDIFEVSNGVTLLLTGTSSMATGFGTITLGNTSIVNYSGANQTVGAVTYGNLTFSGSGIKTAGGAITVNGNTALNGVTFKTGPTTGYNSSIGVLVMNTGSTIALGTGNHTLTIANSSAASWTGTLSVTGWTSGTNHIQVGVGGLSTTQLGQVSFSGYSAGAIILASGELIPRSNWQSQFISMNTGSSSWCAGETRTVTVTVKNVGSSTWSNASPDINIGVKWNAEPDYLVRTDANGLAPGATQTYSLTITSPLTGGSNNLTFDVVNEGNCWFGNNNGSCGPGNLVYVSSVITITPVPAQPSVITGSTSPCQTSSQTYSVTNVSGVTYNWTFPSGWTQTGGGTTNSVTVTVGTGSGNIAVTPSNSCGNGTARTLSVTTTTVPAQPSPITGNTSPCQSSLQLYSVTNVPGVTYNWVLPTGWVKIGGGTSNSITVIVGAASGNVTVTPSNGCGNGTAQTLSVTSTTEPAQPSIISGNVNPCQTSSQVYSVTNVPGVSYNWTFPPGWVQTGGGNTNSVTVTVGAGSGNITVIPSNSCGNGPIRTLAVTISPVPAQPSAINGDNTPQEGFEEIYSVTNVTGVTYNWTFPSGWVQTGGGTTNSITVLVGSGSGNITVTPSNACGNGTPRNLAVTVTLCVVNTFPWTEPFEVPFLPDCWSKIVHNGNNITRSGQQNHTPGGNFSARFSSYSTSSDYNQYLFSPPIHITAGYTDLSFWVRKYNTAAELLEWGVATTTNPNDFTWYSVDLSETQWNQTIVDLSGYTGQTIFIGFHYFGDYLWYVYLDDVSINAHVPQAGLWTGNVSTNWNTAGNWDNGVVPTATTNVAIPSAAPNWPAYSGDLTTGTTCNDITMYGQSQLTVSGNINITTGRTFTCYVNSVVNIGGNFTRTGNFNAGTSTLNFYGNTTSTISGSAAPWVIFDDNFETNKGWTLSGEFQRGAPQGLGGSAGNPDPSTAYSGSNVLGVDLTGLGSYPYDYERNLANRAYQAISPTFDCSGKTNIVLNFRRWLGVQRRDNAYIDISTNNGATWTQIWRNNNTINPSSWSLQTINISAYANNQPQVKIRFCMGTTNNNRQYCGWNIDDVQITAQISSVITFYNLVNSKTNAELISNAHINVINNFVVKPEAWFTNTTNNALNVGAEALFEADATGMASYIDNGGTTVTGATNVQQYVTSERWHLVSSPITDATINTYYDVHLKFYNEPTNTWTYLVNPVTIPMNIAQGYSAWSSDSYLGTTTVTFSTFTGQLNNTEITVDTLDYTVGAPLAGFNLMGNPYPCALNWNSSWPMTNLNGWMQIYDNGVYRGYNIDGTSYNGGTPIIPSTQGFWVRALGSEASITIPLSQRVHNSQDFNKESNVNYPFVSLTAEINGMTDETKLIFSPYATSGPDPLYELEKFENVSDAPTLFTISEGKEFAVNYLPEEYNNIIIPVGFNTGQEGLYQIKLDKIEDLPANVHVYLKDIKEENIIELYENSIYEFSYSPLDEAHRFNLLFKDGYFGTEELTQNEINVYSFNNVVYIRLPQDQKAEIHIYDLMGKEVMVSQSSDEAINAIEITAGTGYYLVFVQTGDQFVTEKVFIR
jgi:hypothetical protein